MMKDEYCVNALKGATFISTLAVELQTNSWLIPCQCPERGDLHFYENIMIVGKLMNCVNALKGATFISTGMTTAEKLRVEMCQCPERGDLHFYPCLWKPL